MKQVCMYFLFPALVAAAGGCYESSAPPSGDATERDPVIEDRRIDDWYIDDWRIDDWYIDDWYIDDWYIDDWRIDDWYIEDVPLPDIPCPSVCTDLPSGSEIGAACMGDFECDYAASCYAESVSAFDGELYHEWYGGSCVLYGAGSEGCDPEVPETCPPGSRCIFMGTYMGQEYHGCFDACEPVNTSGRLYDYNCGCRSGYQCSLTLGICLPGCSHNRECCERWWDFNGDYTRQSDEVVVKEGCTNVCDDAGLFDSTPDPPPYCAASYACINDGDPDNIWGGPCEGDAWCPPDGHCLDEFNYPDPSTGEPYYPGGYCIKEGCNYVGRSCAEHGGGCANLGTPDDPYYACVGACRFGLEIDDPDYQCRSTPGQEQACVPVESSFWYEPPAGADGYCWPGNFPGRSRRIGESCRSDDDCDSPYGLGMCMEWPGISMTPFCSAHCSEDASRDYALCGGDDGTGTAGGVCWNTMCWEGCSSPGTPPGENDCSNPDDMACYDAHMFTPVSVGAGLEVPAGICVPRCTSDSWCREMWSMTMTCDLDTGVCG